MFETDIDIYQHIGQAMFNALPDEWESAYFYFAVLRENSSCEYEGNYFLNEKEFNFSVNKIDGEYEDSECDEAFFALYELMKKDPSDIPWNKARFELMPSGSFDIQFKYDEDFAWYLNLDLDNKQDSKLFDSVKPRDVRQIKSWEGLPDDFERYWLK